MLNQFSPSRNYYLKCAVEFQEMAAMYYNRLMEGLDMDNQINRDRIAIAYRCARQNMDLAARAED